MTGDLVPLNKKQVEYGSSDAVVDGRIEHPESKQFRDVLWGVLFYAHLIAVIITVIHNWVNDEDDPDGNGTVAVSHGVLILFGVSALSSIGLTTITLAIMSCLLSEMIKCGLIFSILMTGAVAVVGFVQGDLFVGIFGLIFFAVGCCYASIVWSRIPFAESNLKTALAAVKQNWGVGFVAFLLVAIAFAWSWFFFMGFSDALYASNWGLLFWLCISYYWVFNVLFNTVVVTTIGTVGTWWMVPDEATSCCSPAVRDSFCRASSYSFGSICLGSLLVAFVQAIRTLVQAVRNGSDDCAFLACLVDCLLGCIQHFIEYMNKWSYTYVGLYGYSYYQAGKGVFRLFESKGWSAIISDDLVDRVLDMISIGVGFLTGLIGVGYASADNGLLNRLDLGENEMASAFLISFVVGFAFCEILMSVIGAAVNAVIVCFAELPREFEQNHPALSAEMRETFTQAWPELTLN